MTSDPIAGDVVNAVDGLPLAEGAPGAGASYTVHPILAGIADDEERFDAIGTPPTGKPRWTPDKANRPACRQSSRPSLLRRRPAQSTRSRGTRRSGRR
ncbi:DUF6192 family protein [Streptomyces sp. NPDC029044]|uniref:DUF6192 family protein n=1 Tax=Streptomyces sp. NPDC029044 TaxID=3157198 RepID=UPI0033FDB3C8